MSSWTSEIWGCAFPPLSSLSLPSFLVLVSLLLLFHLRGGGVEGIREDQNMAGED